jgi:hypothetical protein
MSDHLRYLQASISQSVKIHVTFGRRSSIAALSCAVSSAGPGSTCITAKQQAVIAVKECNPWSVAFVNWVVPHLDFTTDTGAEIATG